MSPPRRRRDSPRRPASPDTARLGPHALVLVAVLAACAPAPAVTYHRDVAPILAARCLGCHRPGGTSGLDLNGYENVRANAGAVGHAVVSRAMPMWLPAAGVRPLARERRLTDQEIATISDWVEAGAPEGSAADYVEPAARDIPVVRQDRLITMPERYLPKQDVDDDYHCFLLDPGFTEPTAITGFDFHPGDSRVVHHISLDWIVPEDRAQAEAHDAASPGPGYPCAEGAERPRFKANFAGPWPLGGTPITYPAGTGIVVPAGAVFVLDVHYNTVLAKGVDDLTSVGIQLAGPEGINPAILTPNPDMVLDIPPGEVRSFTERFTFAQYELPSGAPFSLRGLMPHMHTHGRAVQVWLERADQTVPLIDIPAWNFHGQQIYFFEEPADFAPGDRLGVTCTFDNRSHTQLMVNGVRREPERLTWGFGSFQEMCLIMLYGTSAAPEG